MVAPFFLSLFSKDFTMEASQRVSFRLTIALKQKEEEEEKKPRGDSFPLLLFSEARRVDPQAA